MTPVQLLTQALNARLPSPPKKSAEGWGGNPALNVIDCVLSLNRDYDHMVKPRVEAFQKKHPSLTSLSGLRRLIDKYDSPLEFSKEEHKYRDSSRAETLKCVVDYLLEIQEEFPGSSEVERLRAWAIWARPGDFAFTGIRGFGLTGFQYLRMLFGANTAKPDVRICRFVSESIGPKVSPIKALYLLERAAKKADLQLRDVDAAIWNQSSQSQLAD